MSSEAARTVPPFGAASAVGWRSVAKAQNRMFWPAALIEPDDAHGNLVARRGWGLPVHTAAGGVHHIHAELSPGARVRAVPGRKFAMPVSPALPPRLPPPAACQP